MSENLKERLEGIRKRRTTGRPSLVPVFKTADVPHKVVNDFFQQANASTRKHDYDDPQARLVHGDVGHDDTAQGTAPPIAADVLNGRHFLGWDVDMIVQWTQEYDGAIFSPHHLVVLDKKTAEDTESCLLVSLRGLPEPKQEGLLQFYQIIRADFESSVINLMTKEMGAGGDEHLEGDYEGFDGVLRNGVRDEWERRYYGSQ